VDEHVPEEVFAAHPGAALVMGWAFLLDGNAARLDALLRLAREAAERAGAPVELREQFETLTVALAVVEGRFADGIGLTSGRPGPSPERAWLAASFANAAGIFLMNEGRFEDAMDRFQAGEAAVAGAPFGRAFGVAFAAICEAVQGRIDAAVARAESRHATLGVARDVRVGSVLATALADLYYEQDRLDDAHQILQQAGDVLDDLAWFGVLGTPGLTAARLASARNDFEGARRILELTEVETRRRGSERTHAQVAWEQIRLCLREGDVARAGRLAELAPRPEPDSPPWAYPDGLEARDIGPLRLAVHEGAADRALVAIDRLGAEARKGGWRWRLVKLLLVKAQALHALNQPARAQRALADALEIGVPGGLIRTFVDEGPVVSGLLRNLAEQQFLHVPAPVLARIVAAAGGAGLPAALLAGMAEALSDREREVLEMAAAGLSNQEIAERLFVSLNTVKSHLKHTYSKLGVSSRTAAVAAARERHLLR
jgi:LuxR family maltose regulon positive regulatory protein